MTSTKDDTLLVEAIHQTLMQDPDFVPAEGESKDEAAWAEAWRRFRQSELNKKALSLGGEEPVDKQVAYFTDENQGKISPPIGAPSKVKPHKKKTVIMDQTPRAENDVGKTPTTALQRLNELVKNLQIGNARDVRAGWVRNPYTERQVKRKVGLRLPKQET